MHLQKKDLLGKSKDLRPRQSVSFAVVGGEVEEDTVVVEAEEDGVEEEDEVEDVVAEEDGSG